jgi:hypothetical protein
MIQTSKITQPGQYSGINISNLSNNATLNITPFANLKTLQVSNTYGNFDNVELNFNTFPNAKFISNEASQRISANATTIFNINGTNSSVENYRLENSRVTSLVLKNPTYNNSFGLNIGEIPTGLTYLNIEGNGMTGANLASILTSFSGMANRNNITGGYLNILPYNNLGQSLTLQFPNKTGYYREFWTSDSGEYQLAALLNDGNNPGKIFLSTNYGIDFTTIFTGLTGVYFRSVAASNNLDRIIAVGRDAFAYMSTDSGVTYSIINTGIRTGVNNYTDVAMSSNGQYITLTTNGYAQGFTIGFGAIYCSNDYGATFTDRSTLGGNIRWVSTDMSSNGQYQVACTNQGQTNSPVIHRSINYGVTWTFEALILDLNDIAMSSDGRYQSATADAGIYRSSDYGDNWALAYQDFSQINGYYTTLNTDWRGGISVSADGRYQIAGLTAAQGLFRSGPFYYVTTFPGYLLTSSNYGVTWQRTNFRDSWGSCNLSPNGLHMLAGSRNGNFYTSRTDGADTVYGTYYSRAFNAVQYLRNIKNWTVQFVQGFFGI